MNNNLLLILLVLVVAGAAAVGGYFLFIEDSEDEDSDDTEMVTDTSDDSTEPTQLPDENTTTSVSLNDQAVSFFVPNTLTEVTSGQTSFYKNYPQVDSCEYVGEDSNRELIVVAFETDSDCVDTSRFSDEGTNEIGSFTLSRQSVEGNKDILFYEETTLGNDVSLGFLYKEKFESSVSSDIQDVLESFEVEL